MATNQLSHLSEDDSRPLMSHVSIDVDGTNDEYGTISSKSNVDNGDAYSHHVKLNGATSSSPINATCNIGNPAHPYCEVPLNQDLNNDMVEHYVEQDRNQQKSDGKPPEGDRISYLGLLRSNRNFRWFLTSYLVTHAGEWFTYVASISAIEQIHASNNTTSRTSISILVTLRLLPFALFSNFGGVLADSYDRRKILFILDIIGSLVVWCFLLAYHLKSIPAIYFATVLQMTVAAIYEPCRSALIPMLVADEESLKKASTIGGLAWSVMASVGSSLGGFATELFGISMCFVLDSFTYVLSGLFIWGIRGSYIATESESENASTRVDDVNCDSEERNEEVQDSDVQADKGNTPILSVSHFINMTVEGWSYLRSKPWGAFVLLKPCAALVFGAADVLNVSFAERGVDTVGLKMEGSSHRLGVLFAFMGLGCLLGAGLIDPITDMDNVASLEMACLGSYLFLAIGCWGMSKFEHFTAVCIFTSVRSAGSAVVWIYSSLLLQKFSSTSMLGRVMAVDGALETLSEAFSAFYGGILQDDYGFLPEDVSYLMAMVAVVALFVWGFYFFMVRV